MIKTLYFMFFVCACLLGMMACSTRQKEPFKNLSADDFENLIADDSVQCVDVRTAAEFSDGHIEGSLNLNVMDERFASDAEEVLEPGRPVAVYCKSGRRSRKAARILAKKGFKVYNLDKGFTDWKERGKPVVDAGPAE